MSPGNDTGRCQGMNQGAAWEQRGVPPGTLPRVPPDTQRGVARSATSCQPSCSPDHYGAPIRVLLGTPRGLPTQRVDGRGVNGSRARLRVLLHACVWSRMRLSPTTLSQSLLRMSLLSLLFLLLLLLLSLFFFLRVEVVFILFDRLMDGMLTMMKKRYRLGSMRLSLRASIQTPHIALETPTSGTHE